MEKEKIQTLIELARYAPTASNAQPLQWLVLTDPEQLHTLAEKTVDWVRVVLEKTPEAAPPYMPLIVFAWDFGFDAVLCSAPALIVAAAPEEDFNGTVDLTLALSYLELAAPSLGLGTCWAGLLKRALVQSAELREFLGLTPELTHFYPMMLGYSQSKYHRLPQRKPPVIHWK